MGAEFDNPKHASLGISIILCWLILRALTFVREISICKSASLIVSEREYLNLETIINGEGMDLNLTLIYCAFPGNLPQLTPYHHHHHLLLSLTEGGI